MEYSPENKKKIKALYAELDRIQFKPDYMSLVIDKDKDYYRALKGFSINGIKYRRLVSTVGGMKTGTIVFVNEEIHDELMRRIENGRDVNQPLVPAKLEAYRALTCSASTPVSMPRGILVVHDAETHFKSDTIYLDDESDGEPVMEYRKNTDITMDCTDGFGLMLPQLAARWSDELNLGYLMSGCNTRASWEKGMVFTFDFLEFAEKVAHKYLVTDVWGNEVDIRDVELILTESMLKLWNGYNSIDEYLKNCISNGYTFGITKTCPKNLESERSTNYQFIQPYNLNDEDIDLLIKHTKDEITEVLGDDWRKTILFLCGSEIGERAFDSLNNNYVKALMIEPSVINDPFVRDNIYQLIRNRINEAKVGVLKVHGNYSIISGDPYILCQSIFGMELTGLLHSGEIYNKYWTDLGVKDLACFRAPMSCPNNIIKVHPLKNPDTEYWYQYMTTCTIFNGWDMSTAALNGADFDGDLVMLTDNPVLVGKLNELPAITCVQRKAVKKVPTESDIVKSNIESFGNDIGKVTNRVTSMYEIRARYSPNDEEYKILDYRIKCGQLIQQNVIDKAKGVVAKPMPRTWYDKHSLYTIEDSEKRALYREIIASKKPYFMRYIYPDLMKKYNSYIKNSDRSAQREFGIPIAELRAKKYEELTDQQKSFLSSYEMFMPVGMKDCLMNTICRKFETSFDGAVSKLTAQNDFDYRILKSGTPYTRTQYHAIKKLYDEYNRVIKNYMIFTKYERTDNEESDATLEYKRSEFIRECTIMCPNEYAVCDILLDICYQKSATKRCVWDLCGETIIDNLMKKNNYTVSYPGRDDDGDISYCGKKFSMKTIKIGERD